MSQDRMPITITGKAMLEAELKRLIHTERPAVIKAIEEARSHGDLSENAEYDAAKERQALIEGRIQEIQFKIAGADVIDTSMIKSDKVVFGAHVELKDAESGDTVAYQIVGVDEADVKQGKISILSPLARALIGKKVGETILVQNPRGEKEYELLRLTYK